jgi:hypothetical protein
MRLNFHLDRQRAWLATRKEAKSTLNFHFHPTLRFFFGQKTIATRLRDEFCVSDISRLLEGLLAATLRARTLINGTR